MPPIRLQRSLRGRRSPEWHVPRHRLGHETRPDDVPSVLPEGEERLDLRGQLVERERTGERAGVDFRRGRGEGASTNRAGEDFGDGATPGSGPRYV